MQENDVETDQSNLELVRSGRMMQIKTAEGIYRLVETCGQHPETVKPCGECGIELKFTPEELQEKIGEYIESCKEKIEIVEYVYMDPTQKDNLEYPGEIRERLQKIPRKPMTMSGLANYLKVTRQTLIRLNTDSEFYEIVEKAKSLLEEYAETELYRTTGQVKGVAMVLQNNHGWKDKIDIDGTIDHSFSLARLHEQYKKTA